MIAIANTYIKVDALKAKKPHNKWIPFTAHGFESTKNFYICDIYFISQFKQKIDNDSGYI